jgi:phage tail sheath gpL-like
MGISFDGISQSIRTNTHHIEFNNSRAVQGVNLRKHVALIMGICLAAGTVDELTPKLVSNPDLADNYWGAGSQIAEMCRAFKAANPGTELWGCGIDELAGGTVGTKTITMSGTATESATLQLYIGGRYVPVSIASGDTASGAATKVDAAIKAHLQYKRMPITSGVSSAVVTATMKWKGVDMVDIRTNYNASDRDVAGLVCTIATGVSGAGNPDTSEVITAIGDVWYDTIVHPWIDSTNLGLIETEGLRRWGPMVQKEGAIYCAVTGSLGTATSLGTGRNSPFLRIMPANTSPTPNWIWAAVYGAVNAAAVQADPSRPRQTLPLPGVLPAQPAALWGQADRNTLLYSGCGSHVVDDGGNVTIERACTSYQTNAQSVPDVSYLDAETVDTLAAIRYDLRSSVSLRFPRHKLADDGAAVPPGQPVLTPKGMKAHIASRYDVWSDAGWVEAASKQQFLDELVCLRSASDRNRLEVQLGPDVMNQFRGMSAQISFIL